MYHKVAEEATENPNEAYKHFLKHLFQFMITIFQK